MRALNRIVPAPFLSAALLALWLFVASSMSAGQVVLGLVLALLLPLLTTKVRPSMVRVRRPVVAARYLVTVAYDVVHSNFEVACDVVFSRWRRPQPKFVVIPLELRDPVALAVLAMVTTVVPGTVWSELALGRSALLLHVWNVSDETDFIVRYKARYEKPLREIFE